VQRIGVSLLLAFTSAQQPLESWHALAPGPPSDAVLNCLGRIITPFGVRSTRDGAVVVSVRHPSDDPEPLPVSPSDVGLPRDADLHWIATKGGWLVGFDAGEFGGGLWFVGADGDRRQVSLEGVPSWAQNVHGIVEQQGGPLVFVGLNHLSADFGAVLRCVRREGRWDTRLISRLDGAPGAAARLSNGDAIFVTTRGIGRVTPSGRVGSLLKRDLDGLYPESIATDAGGNVYVGIRGAVIRLRAGAAREEWLVPPGCARFELKGMQCTCGP
jgi:hypothetical protein